MKIHLISYGSENYTLQREFLKETALASSFFDEVTIYDRKDIDASFYMQFQSILNHSKGGGYWIWKPYVVTKALSFMAREDVLVYCDAGCMINPLAKERFQDYIDLVMESETGSLAFELDQKEMEYTKREVFDYFDTPAVIINSNQLAGNVFLLKKCNHTTLLVDEWYNTLSKHPLLFTDDQNILHQERRFLKHKNDQSIFSIIRKTYGSETIADETSFSDFVREAQDYPLWATRLR